MIVICEQFFHGHIVVLECQNVRTYFLIFRASLSTGGERKDQEVPELCRNIGGINAKISAKCYLLILRHFCVNSIIIQVRFSRIV
jgi:hypothetical protein